MGDAYGLCPKCKHTVPLMPMTLRVAEHNDCAGAGMRQYEPGIEYSQELNKAHRDYAAALARKCVGES